MGGGGDVILDMQNNKITKKIKSKRGMETLTLRTRIKDERIEARHK